MADFGISESIALAGMAASAAGAASSMVAQQKRMNAINKLRKRTQAGIEQNRQQAEAAWKEAMAKASPEDQEKMLAGKQAELQDYFQRMAGTMPTEAGTIVTARADAPTIVKTETAKQLGNALDIAKGRMAAQAKLAGWGKTREQIARDLARSGEKIGMYGNFSSGLANAANIAAGEYASAQPAVPLGDILEQAGTTAMQWGPEVGGGFGAARKKPIKSPATSTAWYGLQ